MSHGVNTIQSFVAWWVHYNQIYTSEDQWWPCIAQTSDEEPSEQQKHHICSIDM